MLVCGAMFDGVSDELRDHAEILVRRLPFGGGIDSKQQCSALMAPASRVMVGEAATSAASVEPLLAWILAVSAARSVNRGLVPRVHRRVGVSPAEYRGRFRLTALTA